MSTGASFQRTVIALAIPFGIYTWAWFAAKPFPTGDEPRYLIVALSLAEDGDFDLMNQAAERALSKLYPEAAPLTPNDYCMCPHPRAPLRNPHGIGLPLVLSSFFAVGFSLTGMRIALALIGALTAWQLLELMRRTLGPGSHVLLAWAATVFSVPFVLFATQFYPDMLAALLIIVSLRMVLRDSPASLVGAAATATVLPWLHLKLAPVTAALVLAALFRARLTDPICRRAVIAAIGIIAVGAAGAYALTSYALYGSVSPSAAYRDFTQAPMTARDYVVNFYRNVLGGFLSATYGWIPFAPIHWIGLAGVIPMLRRFRGWAALALAAAAALLATLSTSNSIMHGWALPGRLVAVLVPFIAFPLCIALRRSRALVLLALPLAALSGLLTWQAARHIQDAYADSLEVPGLALPARLAPAWPLFRDVRGALHVYTSSKVLDLQPDRAVAGLVDRTYRMPLTSGSYEASVEMRIAGAAVSDDPVVILRVVGRRWVVLAETVIRPADLSAEFDIIRLPFVLFQDQSTHVDASYTGSGAVELRKLALLRQQSPPSPLTSWPLSACWVLSALIVGALIPRGTRSSARHRPVPTLVNPAQ